jgi:2-dehydropantoate 2-reductase
MKIAVAGVGAMGGRYAYALFQSEQDVTLIDQWVPHVETIRENGYQINLNGEDLLINMPIYFPHEVLEEGMTFDLVILYTNSLQLESMLKALLPVVSNPNTYVLCMLNGMGHEKVIEKYVPITNILLGNTMWTATLLGPGKIKLSGNGTADFRELHPDGKKMARKAIDVLNAADLNANYAENVFHQIYKKATANGATNALCTLMEANLHDYGTTKSAQGIARTIIKEYAAVAAVEGVHLDVDELMAILARAYNPVTGVGLHDPSMYQNLITQGRLTEVDCINGIVVKKGVEYGIPTPYNALITELIHCKEELLKVS